MPCLDKRRCFLCCLHDSLGPIVWKQQRFIIGKGIIRVPFGCLEGRSVWEKKGTEMGLKGRLQQDGYTVNWGRGCLYVWRGNTKDLGYMWAPPAAPAGLGLTPRFVYPIMTSSQASCVVHRHSQYPPPPSENNHPVGTMTRDTAQANHYSGE